MGRFFARFGALLAVASSLAAWGVGARPVNQPLRDSEVLALVGGGALPENVVHEITGRGLGFRVTDEYRSQMKLAGAQAQILAALDSAKAVEEGKQHTELLQHMARAADLMHQKLYPESVKELNLALAASPGSSEVGFVMGELLRQREKWMEAASLYTEILDRDPDFPETHTKLAFVLYRLGDQDRAIRESTEALVRNPDNPEAHKNMGLALNVKRSFDAAISEYREALRTKPDYPPVHYDLGILFFDRGDYQSAIVEYKKAIALDPQQPDYHHNLGIALQKKGDIDGAIREYREAKRLDPNRLWTRNNLAVALVDRDPDSAILEFRELVAMAPDFEACRVCFGRALDKKGDMQGAIDQYRQAQQLDPSDPGPHIGLGSVLEKQQKYDLAMAEYGRALRLDDESTAGHKGMARILMQKKDYVAALPELKRAESLDPNQWQIHDLMAQALTGMATQREQLLNTKKHSRYGQRTPN